MAPWFWYAVVAAVLYGAHQIFTRLASEHIGDGIGGFVVEGVAALTILAYLAFLWLSGRWEQKFTMVGFNYSALTGVDSPVINSLPWLLVLSALIGIVQGQWLRVNRPATYERIGASRVDEDVAPVQSTEVALERA